MTRGHTSLAAGQFNLAQTTQEQRSEIPDLKRFVLLIAQLSNEIRRVARVSVERCVGVETGRSEYEDYVTRDRSAWMYYGTRCFAAVYDHQYIQFRVIGQECSLHRGPINLFGTGSVKTGKPSAILMEILGRPLYHFHQACLLRSTPPCPQ